ncbi:hypothetical protein SAMN04487761_11532 [Lachnospiraceae bacterium C7]|nr:hypothetical protein SAMN04487761_11532 [Lachnospiraceae bacterium C7]
MSNVFNKVSVSFFSGLNSPNRQVYIDCMFRIYDLAEDEISYKLDATRVKDAVALYLLETNVALEDEDGDFSDEKRKLNEKPGWVIRRLSYFGWITVENSEGQYGQDIYITKSGMQLIRFIMDLEHPKKKEYSSYIFNIYNILSNKNQWEANPYINALKAVYDCSRELSDALRDFNTYIKDTVMELQSVVTYEEITENLNGYANGDFTRQYQRLVKQNIHLYRRPIIRMLNSLRDDEVIYQKIIEDCMLEEEIIDEIEVETKVYEMFEKIEDFINNKYEKILYDIQSKIERYIYTLVARMKFVSRIGAQDTVNAVNEVIQILCKELKEGIDEKQDGGEEQGPSFLLYRNQTLTEKSVAKPKSYHRITSVKEKIETLTEEETLKEISRQKQLKNNKFGKEQMLEYTNSLIGDKQELDLKDVSLETQEDFLSAIAMACYAQSNGFTIKPTDEYIENGKYKIANYTIKKED